MMKRGLLLIFLMIGMVGCKSSSTETPVPQSSPAQSPTVTFPHEAPTSSPTSKVPTSTPLPPTPTPFPTATQTPEPSITPTFAYSNIPITGVQVDQPKQEPLLQAASELGVVWVRIDTFAWDLIEPKRLDPPEYDWSSVEEAGLQLLKTNGQQVIGVILFAPPWAQKIPGVACGPIAPDAMDRFAQFMEALVQRYSQSPFEVHHWEIGNEPDVDPRYVDPHSGFGCWGDEADSYYGGEYYAEMLKKVYPRLKAADPEAQVLVGGLLLNCDPINPPDDPNAPGGVADCKPSRFLEGILRNEGGNYLDGVAFHVYDYYFGQAGLYGNKGWNSQATETGPTLQAKINYLRDLLRSYGVEDKSLFATELAVICGRDGKEPQCVADDFQNTKASYLVQAMVSAQANRLEAAVWYAMFGWRNSGLMVGNMKPYPAYQAYRSYNNLMEGYSFRQQISDVPEVNIYEFIKDDRRMWVVWAKDLENHTLIVGDSLAEIPKAIYNLFGEPVPLPEGPLEVGKYPIYIEW